MSFADSDQTFAVLLDRLERLNTSSAGANERLAAIEKHLEIRDSNERQFSAALSLRMERIEKQLDELEKFGADASRAIEKAASAHARLQEQAHRIEAIESSLVQVRLQIAKWAGAAAVAGAGAGGFGALFFGG